MITFLAPLDAVVDRLLRRDGTLEAVAPDRCRFTTHVDSWEWLAVTTATLGVEFRVAEPAAFAEHCAGPARRLGRAAGGRPEAAPDPSTPPPGMASEPDAGAGHGHHDPAPRERWID